MEKQDNRKLGWLVGSGRLRVAAAVVALAAIFVAAVVFIDFGNKKKTEKAGGITQTQKKTTKQTKEMLSAAEDKELLERVKRIAADGDAKALSALYSAASSKGKKLISEYLARRGSREMLGTLKKPKEANEGQVAAEEQKEADKRNEVAAKPDEEKPAEETPADGMLVFKVVDTGSSAPLEGVVLYTQDGRYMTDGQGRALIAVGDKKPSDMWVTTLKRGYVSMRVLFGKGMGTDIPPGYVLKIQRATLIGGVVQNEEGSPIKDVQINFRNQGRGVEQEPYIWEHRVATDASGRWVCDIMPSDLGGVMLHLLHSDYISDERMGIRPLPPTRELQNLTSVMIMIRGLLIKGRVLDEQGNPIRGAKVYKGTRRDVTLFLNTLTDEEGRFSFGAKPGVETLTASADGYAPQLKKVEVSEGMEEVEFRLSPAMEIRAKVVDANSMPVKGASIESVEWQGIESFKVQALTDENGRFEWKDAPADEVYFDISKTGYVPVRRMAMKTGQEEYLITLYPVLDVRGKVIDAETSEPVKEFELIPGYIWNVAQEIRWDNSRSTKFTGGSYEQSFEGKDSFEYAIRIEAEGYKPAVSREFSGIEGKVTYDFRLVKENRLTGIVYLPSGGPAPNAEVIIGKASMHLNFQNSADAAKQYKVVKTGADGRFSLPSQDESFVLAVVHEAGFAQVTSEQFNAQPEIFLQPWGSVEGTLWRGAVRGAGQRVFLISLGAGNVHFIQNNQVITDENGFFSFKRVAAEAVTISYGVETYDGRANTYSKRITVIAGETSYVELGKFGRAVTGQAAVPADYAEAVDWSYSDNWLILKQTNPDEQNQEQDRYKFGLERDGIFKIQYVAAGRYLLRISVYKPKFSGYGVDMTQMLGEVWYEFEMPAGDVNEPFNVGRLVLKMIKPPKTEQDGNGV